MNAGGQANFFDDTEQDQIITAHRESIDKLMDSYDLQSVDVISLCPDHFDCVESRQKFISDHLYSEFEVYFWLMKRRQDVWGDM